MDFNEVTKELVQNNRCPKCAAKIKDKGSYLRCTECDWGLESGSYDRSTGKLTNDNDGSFDTSAR